MTTRGILAGWHNVSTNGTLNVDGVSVQDIISILNTIKSDPRFINWREVLDYMYEHVVDKENPHHVTTDQLATTVIQVIYESWLLEGYSGTLQYFIDLLYRYIEFADDAIMNEELSEEHVPTVDVLARYIEKHNVDLNAHADQINPYFLGNMEVLDPVMSFRQITGLAADEAAFLNAGNTHYENMVLQSGQASDEFTFVMSFDFIQRTMFQYKNSNGSAVLRVISDPANSRILFTRCVSNNPNVPLNVSVGTNLNTLANVTIDHVAIPNSKSLAKCAIMSKGSRITYVLFSRYSNKEMNVAPEIIEVDVEGTPLEVSLPTKPKPFWGPIISFARMNPGDALTDLIYYPQYLTIENLLYVYEWLDGNVRELPVVLNPDDEENPEDIEQPPTEAVEPDTAPMVYLSAGDIGKLKVSSTAEAWRPIETVFLDDIVSLVHHESITFAATRTGIIYTTDHVNGWELGAQLENIKINKFWYSDQIFVVVGTYDLYLPENNGVILVSTDGYEWSIVWEDWGPAFHDCCCGGYITPYNKDLLFVFVGDGGRIGYIEAENIFDFPNGDMLSLGPNGVCDLKCVAYGNNIYVAAGSGAMVTSAVGKPWSWYSLRQVGDDDSITWRHIEFLNPEFILVGDGGYISKSVDGRNWSAPVQVQSLADPVLCSWYDVVYAHDTLVLVGNSGRVTRSVDFMESWSTVKQISDYALNTVITKEHRDVEKELLYAVDGTSQLMQSIDMINWTVDTIETNIEWSHILTGNGVLVACGSNGNVAYSLNGVTWSEPLSIAENGFQLAEFIGGMFYLIAGDGAIYTSANGQTWAYLRTLPDCGFVGYTSQGLSGDGTGKFVVAFGNYYYRSLDNGLTWTKVLYSSAYWVSSAYGNGKWVLVGMAGRVSSSVDTLTWTAPIQPLGSLLFNDIDFGNGVFVAVTSTNKVAKSIDGVNWTYVTVGSGEWTSVTFSGGKFIITNNTQLSESLDGVAWSSPVSTDPTITDAVYADNYYHTIKQNGTVFKSPSLNSLVQYAVIMMKVEFKKLIFGYTYYDWYQSSYVLALADDGLYSYLEGYSGWTPVYKNYPHPWIGGTFDGTVWTLVASDGAIVSSYDDQAWDWSYEPVLFPGLVWRDVTSHDGITVVAGNNGYVLRFTDPRNLGSTSTVFTKNWIKILHDGAKFILLSDDGFITTSSDGITWSALVDTKIGSALDMCFGAGLYVALNTTGSISKSTDLVNWSTPEKIGTESWAGILYAKYKYILYSGNSVLSVSDTGAKWREYVSSTPLNFMDVEVGPLIVLPEGGIDYSGGGDAPA